MRITQQTPIQPINRQPNKNEHINSELIKHNLHITSTPIIRPVSPAGSSHHPISFHPIEAMQGQQRKTQVIFGSHGQSFNGGTVMPGNYSSNQPEAPIIIPNGMNQSSRIEYLNVNGESRNIIGSSEKRFQEEKYFQNIPYHQNNFPIPAHITTNIVSDQRVIAHGKSMNHINLPNREFFNRNTVEVQKQSMNISPPHSSNHNTYFNNNAEMRTSDVKVIYQRGSNSPNEEKNHSGNESRTINTNQNANKQSMSKKKISISSLKEQSRESEKNIQKPLDQNKSIEKKKIFERTHNNEFEKEPFQERRETDLSSQIPQNYSQEQNLHGNIQFDEESDIYGGEVVKTTESRNIKKQDDFGYYKETKNPSKVYSSYDEYLKETNKPKLFINQMEPSQSNAIIHIDYSETKKTTLQPHKEADEEIGVSSINRNRENNENFEKSEEVYQYENEDKNEPSDYYGYSSESLKMKIQEESQQSHKYKTDQKNYFQKVSPMSGSERENNQIPGHLNIHENISTIREQSQEEDNEYNDSSLLGTTIKENLKNSDQIRELSSGIYDHERRNSYSTLNPFTLIEQSSIPPIQPFSNIFGREGHEDSRSYKSIEEENGRSSYEIQLNSQPFSEKVISAPNTQKLTQRMTIQVENEEEEKNNFDVYQFIDSVFNKELHNGLSKIQEIYNQTKRKEASYNDRHRYF